MPNFKFLISHPAHFFALGFGSGLSPKAPGTFGTIVGLILFYALLSLPQLWHLPIIALLFVVGIPLCGITGKNLGVSDHGAIVWDEIVAMMLVLTFVPLDWLHWLMAFALFRLFDIWKPFPIRQCDAKFKGGFGVMFDDLLAAVYAILTLEVINWAMLKGLELGWIG